MSLGRRRPGRPAALAAAIVAGAAAALWAFQGLPSPGSSVPPGVYTAGPERATGPPGRPDPTTASEDAARPGAPRSTRREDQARADLRGSLSFSGAWALYPLVLRWAEEFRKLHPAVRLDVQAGGAGKGVADVLAGVVDAGMVSRRVYPAEKERGALALPVAKDAVVPTLNRKNPALSEILARGLTRRDFAAIWMKGTVKSWQALVPGTKKAAVHAYTRSDACGAAETWAAYLGGRQEDLGGIGVYGDPGVAEAVRRDPLGIGYNNVNFAYDPKTRKPVDGLAVCPIDLDGNGRLDEGEKVYAARDDLIRAVAAGVYPSPPARELYLVLKGLPRSPLLAAFLRWALTEGQAFVEDAGYLPLPPERIAAGLASLVSGKGGRP